MDRLQPAQDGAPGASGAALDWQLGDPATLANPDLLDLARNGVARLAFGFGIHICLGFPLARTEGQVAVPALLRHYRRIEPMSPSNPWINSPVFRGMSELRVRVQRA